MFSLFVLSGATTHPKLVPRLSAHWVSELAHPWRTRIAQVRWQDAGQRGQAEVLQLAEPEGNTVFVW